MSSSPPDRRKPEDYGWSLGDRSPAEIARWMPIWGWLYKHYFQVQTSGWEHVPRSNALFVGSHNGGLAAPDMYMTMYDWFRREGLTRRIYGLSHHNLWYQSVWLSQMATRFGSIRAHPKMGIAALNSGASVLVYPGGAEDVFRPHSQRHKIEFAGRTGFIKLALRCDVPIVPIVSNGAHDTLFVLGDIHPFAKQLHDLGLFRWPGARDLDPEIYPVYLGLPWGLSIGPWPNLPLPVPLQTRICPPIVFERTGREAARDRSYVEACCDRVRFAMQRELERLVAERAA
ncbi:MAG: lysophospholipid acyltransferase family protein [Geitlerinemataceae cyanobacterium]